AGIGRVGLGPGSGAGLGRAGLGRVGIGRVGGDRAGGRSPRRTLLSMVR
ncbi:MAG: hypothetical protein QOE57_811, partial [Acidimicrobiaceae bacterium]|nr:hypothetical protein [Acidimicrobiaceae bacterium]